MIIGKIIDNLIHAKDNNRRNLTISEIEAINDACNILDHRFDRYSETNSIIRDHIASTHWTTADIETTLVESGYEPCEENVSAIRNYPGLNECLQERGAEAGREAIRSIISDSKESLLVLQSDGITED